MRFRLQLVNAILALQFLLSLLQLLDAHEVWYYPMIHRVTYSMRFDLGVSLILGLLSVSVITLIFLLMKNKYMEILVSTSVFVGVYFLFGLEAAVAWFSIFQIVLALLFLGEFDEFLFWFLFFITCFEALCLIHWFLLPLGIVSPLTYVAGLEMALFYILGLLAPLIVVFAFIIVLVDFLSSLLVFNKFLTILQVKAQVNEIISYVYNKRFFSLRYVVKDSEPRYDIFTGNFLFLIFVIMLSIIAAVYPYSKVLNPESFNVGVDIPYYVYDAKIVERDVLLAFEAWNRTRPMIFITIFGFQGLFNLDVVTAVRFLPVLLNPLLALAVFFFVSEGFSDNRLGVWAAFFTVCGIQITVGMYSYFLANMLGLCFIYVSLGFLFKALRNQSKYCLISASVFGSAVVFTHPWTLIQYLIPFLIAFLILYYELFHKFGDKTTFKIISIYFTSISFAEFFKILIFHGYSVISASSQALNGISELSNFWHNTITVFRILYGGTMSNLLLLGLPIGGVLFLNNKSFTEIYIRTFMTITLAVLLFSNDTNMSRLIYNIPFGLLSSLGYVLIYSNIQKIRIKNMFTLFIILIMVVYMLRSMANII